jgi:hypothetical protein
VSISTTASELTRQLPVEQFRKYAGRGLTGGGAAFEIKAGKGESRR